MKRKVIIDIGTYTGDTITLAIRKYQDADLFVGYEPSKQLFESAKKNLVYSDKVDLRNAGVGAKPRTEKLFLDPKDYISGETGLGNSIYDDKERCTEEFEYIRVEGIKNVIKEFEGDYLVLKINAEGVEYEILEEMIHEDLFRFVDEFYVDWHAGKVKRFNYEYHWDLVRRCRKAGHSFTGLTRGDSFGTYVSIKDWIPQKIISWYYVLAGRKAEIIFDLKALGRKLIGKKR